MCLGGMGPSVDGAMEPSVGGYGTLNVQGLGDPLRELLVRLLFLLESEALNV